MQKAEGSSDDKERIAGEKFLELAGEKQDEFIQHLTANGGKPGEKRRMGGHVEQCMASCNSNVRIVMIDGDEIHKGMDRDQALDRHVYDTTWPDEREKSMVVYAVRINKHFMWGVVNDGEKQKALFPIEEGNEAVNLIVDHLLTREPPISMRSLIAMPKERRKAAIMKQITKPQKKKRKKNVTW